MGIFEFVLKQVSKPTGFFGQLLTVGMNYNHSQLTNWGLSFLSIKKTSTILDIGCGGGATIKKLSKDYTTEKIYGIDYSVISVKSSIRTNKTLIKNKRVDIEQGSVSSLPYNDNLFDIVTGINTHIFWPDLENDMKEVLRVLKPKGTLMVAADIYKNDRFRKRNFKIIENTDIHFHDPNELQKIFEKSGFKNVTVEENCEKGWICGYGMK